MSALILVTLEWQGQGKESLHLLRQDAGGFTERRQVMSAMTQCMIYPTLTQITQGPRAKGKYGAGRGRSTCLESPPAWVT